MTTVKEFETQKQKIADYFVNKFLCKIIRKDDEVNHLLKLIDNLQPPRPTCASCTKDNLCAWDLVSKVDYDLEETEFGCNKHSDYDEVKNA